MIDEREHLADLGRALYPAQGPSPRLRHRVLTATRSPAPRARWLRPAPIAVAAGVVALAIAGGSV
ncbi:MAG: hypothetical protein J2P15_22325, partial [Micromonosporaceae bacterium]|nr:hypothetical protein [Micromonosporaceae bacterium]